MEQLEDEAAAAAVAAARLANDEDLLRLNAGSPWLDLGTAGHELVHMARRAGQTRVRSVKVANNER
jgi:hypothetical protein